jgi:hypothetical protein
MAHLGDEGRADRFHDDECLDYQLPKKELLDWS